MKHVPHGREESKQPGVETQGPINDQPGTGTQEEHGQQQADEVLLEVSEQPSVTKQRERGACADVPEE